MQTVSTDQLVGQTVGHYYVKSLLGRGRLSAVYLAQHPSQNTTAALTAFIIPDRFKGETRTRFNQRFMREAAALTALSHQNILPVHEYGEQFGYPYLITPYMTHGSLADICKRQGRLTPTHVLQVLERIAAGLEYAHNKGVVHGTLKPANILLSTDQKLLVAGFSLVHMLQMRGIEQNDQPYSYLFSIADTFLYASAYIAPEVVQGQPIDVRSDIYALGIMLFELLCGKPPFAGTSPLDTALQHVKSPLPSLHKLCPDVPIALELVINHALARDPTQRFQHVSELIEAFAQVCKGVVNVPQRAHNNERPLLSDKLAPMQHLQNIPEEEISIGGWQLTPPIVTGKLLAPRTNTGSNSVISAKPPANSSDGWQIMPPIITGRVAAVRPSQQLPAAQSEVSPVGAPLPTTNFLQLSAQNDAPSHEFAAHEQEVQIAQPISSLPTEFATNDKNDMKTPLWWIQAPVVPLKKMQEEPIPNQEQRESVEQDKQIPSPDAVVQVRPAKRSRNNVGRRRVIATLAAGGIVAAGAVIAGKMNLVHFVIPPTIQGGTTTSGQQKQSGATGMATPNPGKTATTPTNKATSKVVGATNLAKNTAITIVNPADGKAGLLIHLSNGNFVAYERACTHEGVNVNYDPMTHTLVCPAHNAVFDPLKNAAVVHGPAIIPLTPIAIRVNADGTITVG